LLTEKGQESAELKRTIEVLYSNNRELQDINVRLYEQVEKTRCGSLHEIDRKKLSDDFDGKVRSLQTEAYKKVAEETEKVKELSDHNLQLIS
jgi:hypothetical protein